MRTLFPQLIMLISLAYRKKTVSYKIEKIFKKVTIAKALFYFQDIFQQWLPVSNCLLCFLPIPFFSAWDYRLACNWIFFDTFLPIGNTNFKIGVNCQFCWWCIRQNRAQLVIATQEEDLCTNKMLLSEFFFLACSFLLTIF